MYTREEASTLRQAFWTTFGQYMSPILSAEGLKVNWVNYNTHLKNVLFRMHADQKKASIAIEINHPDTEIQELFFQQFLDLQNLLHETVGETWKWELHYTDENNRIYSRIVKEISPVTIFNRDDWPTVISFLKPRIIALDEFWTNAQYSFESLR